MSRVFVKVSSVTSLERSATGKPFHGTDWSADIDCNHQYVVVDADAGDVQPASVETLNGKLTGHVVAYRDMSADDWSTLSVDAPANSVTVGNLSLFVTYEFKVRSVNSVGVSEYSLPLAHYTELGRSSLHSLSFTMLALHTHTHTPV